MVDLSSEYAALKPDIDAAIERVLQSGIYLNGSETLAFEADFAEYLGVSHAVSAASGTDALQLAMMACGIGPGDGVITVANGSVATVAAIELAGAAPVLVDVDAETYTLNPELMQETLRRRIHPSIRGVIPVHLYGCPAPMMEITEIARKFGLYVIEDCAQSHGASVQGRRTGSFGDFGAFSFYPTKNLGAMGDGGLLVTNNPELAYRAARIKQYGWRDRYISEQPGMNSRLDEVQAAVLRVKLRSLDDRNRKRRANANVLDAAIAGSELRAPHSPTGALHVYHQYVLRVASRNRLRQHLQECGVSSNVHYPVPIHCQPAYRERIQVGYGSMSVSEMLAEQVVSLPVHPFLSEPELCTVANACRAWEG